jgi:hypothetical protein
MGPTAGFPAPSVERENIVERKGDSVRDDTRVATRLDEQVKVRTRLANGYARTVVLGIG